MTDFFIYRSCDVSGTGTREAVMRNADVLNRGTALLREPSGLPADDAPGSDNPTLDVAAVSWALTPGAGTLPPGTYAYGLVPVNTCTGRTGQALPLPPLTISALGEQAVLRVQFNTVPDTCIGAYVQRDGVLVGPPLLFAGAVQDNVPVVTNPPLTGTFNAGTATGFNIVSGADLIVGDTVLYQGKGVRVAAVAGPTVTIDPPLVSNTPPLPSSNAYDAAARTGVYETLTLSPAEYTITIPPLPPIVFQPPVFSFRFLGLPGLLAYPQIGDVIVYGSKTAIVLAMSPITNVAVVAPFGLLPIPPFPAGLFWLVFRPSVTPNIGAYFDADVVAGTAATGSIVAVAEAAIADGDTFTLADGVNPAVTFEFDKDSNVTSGNVAIVLAGGETATQVRNLITAAINGATLDITASNSGAATTTLLNDALGVLGNQPITQTGPLTISGMAGGVDAYGQATVLASGGVPLDPDLAVNRSILLGAHLTSITNLEPGTNIGGGADPTRARITFSPPFSSKPIVINGALPIGPYVLVPEGLSQFLTASSIAPTGSYTRLSRTVSFSTENRLWQWEEKGQYQERTGTVDGSDARSTLNDLLLQNNYPGGLDGLLARVRGPSASTPSRVFVDTNGEFTRIDQRLYAVNRLALEGNGTVIDLSAIRELRSDLCDDVAVVSAVVAALRAEPFAAVRFETRTVTVAPAACPPGQASTQATSLRCLGLVTSSQRLRSDESARFYWRAGARFSVGIRARLRALGFTDEEADGLVSLTPVGRVLSVSEDVPSTTADFLALGSTSALNDVLNDDRIQRLNTGSISLDLVQSALRRRRRAGIIRRAPGTDESRANEPGYQPIEDFTLLAHNLAAELFQFQGSFDLCDVEGALNSIDDPTIRAGYAALFAVIDDAFRHLKKAGSDLRSFLTEGLFADALKAVAGVIVAVGTDRGLRCMFGPFGSASLPGIPSIPALENLFQGLSSPLARRFELGQLFGASVTAVFCEILAGVQEIIGKASPAASLFVERVVGCAPSVSDLATAGITFPSLEIQVTIECSSENAQIILALANEMIAEANEVISFANEMQFGFVTRSVSAKAQSCASDQAFDRLIKGLEVATGVELQALTETATTALNASAPVV